MPDKLDIKGRKAQLHLRIARRVTDEEGPVLVTIQELIIDPEELVIQAVLIDNGNIRAKIEALRDKAQLGRDMLKSPSDAHLVKTSELFILQRVLDILDGES